MQSDRCVTVILALAGEDGLGGERNALLKGLVHRATASDVAQAGALLVVEFALDEDLAADPVNVTRSVGFAVIAVAGVHSVVFVTGRDRVEFPTLAPTVQRHRDAGAGGDR